jgi:hypothetical protein
MSTTIFAFGNKKLYKCGIQNLFNLLHIFLLTNPVELCYNISGPPGSSERSEAKENTQDLAIPGVAPTIGVEADFKVVVLKVFGFLGRPDQPIFKGEDFFVLIATCEVAVVEFQFKFHLGFPFPFF